MKKNKTIIAGIILYNPDIIRLQENVEAIFDKVDSILFVDNASKNIIDIQRLAEKFSIKLVVNNENYGLPQVFNAMLQEARDNNFDNLLLLDQDSVCGEKMIEVYREHISSNYVCLTPQIRHRLKEFEEKSIKTTLANEEIDFTINSGTLINLNVLPNDVKFNEKLFVDCVDFDFFIQLKEKKLKVLRINTIYLLCDLGNMKVHHIFHFPLFSNNYSVFRLEKQARDRVIFIYSHFKNSLAKEVVFHSFVGYLTIIMFEKNKIFKLIAVFKGVCKGVGILFKNKRKKFL
ncbi:MAG: glycosyltransferase [Fibrobacteraceae bacterium]|nr:glycosyltransferase [Fibrobacteraceae bacterium]